MSRGCYRTRETLYLLLDMFPVTYRGPALVVGLLPSNRGLVVDSCPFRRAFRRTVLKFFTHSVSLFSSEWFLSTSLPSTVDDC